MAMWIKQSSLVFRIKRYRQSEKNIKKDFHPKKFIVARLKYSTFEGPEFRTDYQVLQKQKPFGFGICCKKEGNKYIISIK